MAPPLTGTAVKVTEVPKQIGPVGLGVMLTLENELEPTVKVILAVADGNVVHKAEVFITHTILSPLFGK